MPDLLVSSFRTHNYCTQNCGLFNKVRQDEHFYIYRYINENT